MLLGVNADPTRQMLRATQQHEKLPWRSWWDGQGGPITRDYGVDGFPTVFLIDHKGRVRYQTAGIPPRAELDAVIEKLVKEAEQDRAAPNKQG